LVSRQRVFFPVAVRSTHHRGAVFAQGHTVFREQESAENGEQNSIETT
jgi:hypothetical protein